MPEFYIIIALKIFFPEFQGDVPPAPVSYAYASDARSAARPEPVWSWKVAEPCCAGYSMDSSNGY